MPFIIDWRLPTEGARHGGDVPSMMRVLHECMAKAGFVDAPGELHFASRAVDCYTEASQNLDGTVLWVWRLEAS